MLPEVLHEPQFHNPFPQLEKVAVLPFYNQSDNPNVNQDKIAQAYINELQKIPGYVVVPLGVTQEAVRIHEIGEGVEEFRRLGRILGVDAIVVGSVTDYHFYYPQRMGLAVNWYSVNPYFHPAPPGYGLPFGTSQEGEIPQRLVNEAEFALAKAQLKTQSPHTDSTETTIPLRNSQSSSESGQNGEGLPDNWPNPEGFIPPLPQKEAPAGIPSDRPVMEHIRVYNAHDASFTEALESYYDFRDDARFGGWQSYTERPNDFNAFCCYLSITEMLASRGGSDETRVVWRWSEDR